MENNRVNNSFLNMILSGGGQIINLATKFLLRSVFIYVLGKEYLGLDGLFSS